MAFLKEESRGGKKPHPVGSPEWLWEQKILTDQRNRQWMLAQKRREAKEKRQQEEIPLPSADTATRNPVDSKTITYEPEIQEFEREELRKAKKAAIERSREQWQKTNPQRQSFGDISWLDKQQTEKNELGNWKNVAIEQTKKDIADLPNRSPVNEYPNLRDYIITALDNTLTCINDDDHLKQLIGQKIQ